MAENRMLGDFDFAVNEVLLIHHCVFDNRHRNADYQSGRKVAGIVYCIRGRAEYNFGGEKLILEPGRMIFLPASCSYIVQNAGTEPFYHITANFHLRAESAAPHTVASDILSGRLRHISSAETAPLFKEQLDRLYTMWQTKPYGYRLFAKSALYEILYLYFTDAGKNVSAGSDYRKLLPAKVLLDEHYTESLAISELAARCRLSETHFRRLFARLFGCSPTDYRISKRVLKAKDLLLSGEYTVSQAAEAVGFEDANYFSRVFKQHTGTTPSAVRSGGGR